MKITIVLYLLTFIWATVGTQLYTIKTNDILFGNEYLVDYNNTIGQSNYALAIAMTPDYTEPCWCNNGTYQYYHWKPANLSCEDFDNTSLVMGHLIPRNIYQGSICNMTNIVPLFPEFNYGVWAYIDRVVGRHLDKLIIRGCKYNMDYIIDDMYVPIGCYYIVASFNYTFRNPFEIYEYGYVSNLQMGNSPILQELPWWIELYDQSNSGSILTSFPTLYIILAWTILSFFLF